MKKRLLFVLLNFLVFAGLGQQLTFKMDHPRLIRSSNKQWLRFDVLMKASQPGTYLYASQVAFNCNAVYFISTPSTNIQVTKGFITGTYNGNQMYLINSAQWTGNKFAIQITANNANDGEDPADACVQVLTEYQVLVTIGLEVADPAGIAGISFRTTSMEAGPGGLQHFALNPLPDHGDYDAPNLFEGENFHYLYLGRLFSSLYGWSQFGGPSNDIPYLDWSVAVNTSIWDSTGTIDGSAVANKLRIHSMAEFIIDTQAQMNCYDSMEIGKPEGLYIRSSSGATGSLIDNGIITYINNGTAAVERYLSQDRWHGYCIPLQSTVTQPFLDLQLLMKWYDEPEHRYRQVVNPAGDSVLDTQMRGYFVYSNSSLTPNSTITVRGGLNTGSVSIPVTSTIGPGGPDGWNLIGNPYPSGVVWPSINLANVDPVMYIFDPQRGNYIFWNSNDATRTVNISPLIPAMQGFYIHCHAPAPGIGAVSVNNSARVHDNAVFYKPAFPLEELLVLTAYGSGFRDEAQIWFNDAATPSFDWEHDAYKLWGDMYAPQLYSELIDSNLAILNVLPWAEGTVVPMGYKPGIPGTDTIIASNIESFSDTLPVWIHDLLENRWQELTDDPVYIFNASPADNPDRFRICFADPGLSAGNTDPEIPAIYSFEDWVYVKFSVPLQTAGSIVIYDMLGRPVFRDILQQSGLNRFRPGILQGYYLVKVVTGDTLSFAKVFLNR